MSTFANSSNWRLTDEQKQHYITNGFVIVRDLLTVDEQAALRTWVSEVKSWPNKPHAHMHYEEIDTHGERQLTITENFVDGHPQLGRLLKSPELAALAGGVTGEEMLLFKEKIVYKQPGGGGFPAHQDSPSYTQLGQKKHLSLAMAVEPATQENGCVEVVPGSHLLKNVPQRADQCISDEWCANQHWEPIVLDTGDICIFSSLLIHRSADNKSNNGRAMLYATFNHANEGGDQRKAYYEHRRQLWPATFEREPGVSYKDGYELYAWGTPMGTIEKAVMATSS